MGEIAQGFKAVFSVIASLLFSTVYMIGGRPESFLGIRARLWKRVIAPLILASSAVIFSILARRLGWRLFATILWFIPWGYGAENITLKLYRRLIQSLLFTVPALIFGIFGGNIEVAIYQMVFGAAITVIFGVRNPVKASQEELLIAFSNTFLMGVCLL